MKGNLTVFLNVNVTNKPVVGAEILLPDVLLTVDTGSGPAPANVSGQPNGVNAVAFNGFTFTKFNGNTITV